MTIKAFAFEVQSSLRKASGIALKRSHVHEVLAALLGFSSYAALINQRVLAQHDGSVPEVPIDLQRGANRVVELGYPQLEQPLIAAAVANSAEALRIYAIPLEAVLDQLDVEFDELHPEGVDTRLEEYRLEAADFDEEDEGDDDGMFFALDFSSTVLRESLTRMAEGGNASAYVALARLCEEAVTDLPESGADGRFWFEQQQSGRLLTGIEIEWAAAYVLKQDMLLSRTEHLRRAAELGNAEAALRELEIELTDEKFDQATRLATVKQAARLANVALFLGRDDDARQALRLLAKNGDTNAMRRLVEGLETNLKDAWTWVHLARRLGVDLEANQAVDEDGLPVDADGPMAIYADGGIDLKSLSDREAGEAWEAADQIFAKLVARSSNPGQRKKQ